MGIALEMVQTGSLELFAQRWSHLALVGRSFSMESIARYLLVNWLAMRFKYCVESINAQITRDCSPLRMWVRSQLRDGCRRVLSEDLVLSTGEESRLLTFWKFRMVSLYKSQTRCQRSKMCPGECEVQRTL